MGTTSSPATQKAILHARRSTSGKESVDRLSRFHYMWMQKRNLHPTKLQDLVIFQEGMALKIAPNLSRDILQLSHFKKKKMKVSSVMHVSYVRPRNPVPTPAEFSYARCVIIVGQVSSTKTDTYVLYHLAAYIIKVISNSTVCDEIPGCNYRQQ